MNITHFIPTLAATLKRAIRSRRVFIPLLLFAPTLSISADWESKVESINSQEGKEILTDDWKYLISGVAIGSTPKINLDRIHLTYKLKQETQGRLQRTSVFGCKGVTSGCKTEKVDILEYQLDCLAQEYREVRSWAFSFEYYPHQGIGGVPSLQSSMYFGERRNTAVSWTKATQGSLHKAIADGLCKKVLPGGG